MLNDIKSQWTLYAVVASLVQAVAKLAVAAAARDGSLRAAELEGVDAMLDEVLGQLDSLLVLGTHVSILAESLAATSGAVQRLRNKHELRDAPTVALEETRELVAGARMSMRGPEARVEEYGPDTDRDGALVEGAK